MPVSLAHDLVSGLAGLLQPVAGGLAATVAIVLFTMLVRLLLTPLAVPQIRGQRRMAELLPQLQELQKKHAKDPARLQRETAALYRAQGSSLLRGFLPGLLQMPFFMVMYRLFASATVAGHQNLLLAHTLLATPLGQNWLGVGLLSPPSLVFLGLFALLAAVAWWTSRRATGLLRLLPYGTIVMAMFMPLAAGVYLLTSGAWTAAERTVLQRRFA
ncbi:YidC/Oxa1 family membrane protein insertase [Actinomadura macrotermitis]|nr:membrane protein insertase YidC [Actinomadura macrotermitis]